MKKTTGKTYAGIVLVAILVLFLANPRWLPVSQSLKESLEETEKNHMLFQNNSHTSIAQIITLILAIAIVWLVYQVLKLIFNALAVRGGRTQTVTNLIS